MTKKRKIVNNIAKGVVKRFS